MGQHAFARTKINRLQDLNEFIAAPNNSQIAEEKLNETAKLLFNFMSNYGKLTAIAYDLTEFQDSNECNELFNDYFARRDYVFDADKGIKEYRKLINERHKDITETSIIQLEDVPNECLQKAQDISWLNASITIFRNETKYYKLDFFQMLPHYERRHKYYWYEGTEDCYWLEAQINEAAFSGI
ncbi:hypothetical protein ACOME3_002182 [Neoechinorhynchus agilis]